MPNVPEQTRQSLVMLCDVLNNADAYTPNEVHLANAGLFALEQVLAGEFEQLGTVLQRRGLLAGCGDTSGLPFAAPRDSYDVATGYYWVVNERRNRDGIRTDVQTQVSDLQPSR